MTNPNDVANVMWITMPFLFASLVFTVLKCVKNPTQLRVVLIFAFLLAIIANSVLIVTLGGFELANFSVLYLLGVTAYNLSMWTSRMYVCLRMAKLSPSPAMSTSFQHLAYVSGTLFAMTEVTYVTSAITFYKTNPFEVPASPNETAFACNLVANFMFEFASVYLHVKSLKMFATSNVTGIKLYIISCSTLTCIFFGFVQSGAQITLDVMTELMMAGIQVAILPSSIVLGEAIAIRVGKHFGDSRSPGSALQPGSQGNKSCSQANKTPTGSVHNMNKRAPSKTAIATSSMDKSPIRETPVLVSPSV